MRRLSNDELATRTREHNRRRSERQRQRLTIAGHAALTVWLPVGLRRDFVAEAAACGVNINELATQLIEKGLRESKFAIIANMPDPDGNYARGSNLPDPDTADLFATPDLPIPLHNATPDPQTPVVVADTASTHTTVSVNSDRDAMMALVAGYMADGLTGADIARKLTDIGYRASNGAALRGANVLREYRAWTAKNCGSDSTAV